MNMDHDDNVSLNGPRTDSDIDLDLDMEMQSNTDFDEMELDPSATKSAFEQTTESLLRLQAISLDRFRIKDGDDDDGNYGEDGLGDIDVPFNHTLGHPTAGGNGSSGGGSSNVNGNNNQPDVNIDIASVSPADAPKVLRDVVRKLLGGSRSAAHAEPLKYEVLEERASGGSSQAPRYSCILTLFRPTGSSRSYRTKSEYSKSSEARAAAAHLALRLGAVEFMKNGDKSRDRIQLVPLGRLGTGAVELEQPPEERDTSGDLAILDIENCCTEWRSGTVHPQWIYLTDNRFIGSYGCALKISLSAHVQRAYSVVPGGIISSSSIISYPSKSHAKSACAKLAIAEGVLDFIKHGDGLEQPVRSGLSFDHAGASGAHFGTPAATVLTLQGFYDSLPKPMPDSIGTKMNGDFNAIPWLNNMIQMTKGSRMTSSFHWYTDPKVGLHGCLLRLTRPDGPSKTYIVDASFSKRSDAKVAVCLWACSQGLGTYVQQVAAEIDSLVTPEMRRRCEKELLPTLGCALRKIRPGLRVDFGYVCDLASFCCTLTIDLSSIVDKGTAPVSSSDALPSAEAEEPESESDSEEIPKPQDTDDENENARAPLSTTPREHGGTENIPPPPPVATTPPRAEPEPRTGTGTGSENESKAEIWVTRTKSQYKSKQDARVAAICLAFEEGVMQWVESFQKLRDLNGSGENRTGRGISNFGFVGKGLGHRGRRRGFGVGLGMERGGRRQQAFGRGFGRGRGGYPGYGYGYGNAAVSVSRGATTSNTTSANVAGSSRGDTDDDVYANANVNMELEEGEMLDGVKAGSALGRTEPVLLNGRAARGRGVGFGRGRGRGLGTVYHGQQPQKSHPVMPHINPRFFPHLNVIPSPYPPYQPQQPALPAGYNYATYYNSTGPPGFEPNHHFESEWYEESEHGGEFVSGYAAMEPSLYQVRPSREYGYKQTSLVWQETNGSRVPSSSGPSGASVYTDSGPSGAQSSSQALRQQQQQPQQQQERPATQQSAHYGSQLDTADTASDAGIKRQLLPSSVDADKRGAELGDHERGKAGENNVNGEKGGNVDEENEGKGKNKDPEGSSTSNREDVGDPQESKTLKIEAENGERELTTSASGQRVVVSEAAPSNPRAMRSYRNLTLKNSSRYSNSNSNLAGSSVISSQVQPYPSEFDYYGQSAVAAPPPPPPPPEYPTSLYQYPHPYQQQRPLPANYRPYNYHEYYYQEPQMPAYTISNPYSAPYLSHPQAHSHYPYPAGYPPAPVGTVGPGGPLPPSGPRAMLSRPKPSVSGEGASTKQPPIAPKAMIQKLRGRQDASANEGMSHPSSSGKRARVDDITQSSGTAGFQRKRMKIVS